jgi:hypothetical protein
MLIQIAPSPSAPVSPWTNLVFSGVVAAALTVFLNFYLAIVEGRRKRATEDRQFAANRALNAVALLRQAFFSAKTEVRYLLLAYSNIEDARTRAHIRLGVPYASKDAYDIDESFEREKHARLELFNQRGSDLEALAESALDILNVDFIPAVLMARMHKIYSGFKGTWPRGRENERIKFYEDQYGVISETLKEVELAAQLYARQSEPWDHFTFLHKTGKVLRRWTNRTYL